jgi:hypothetical protein
MPTRKLSLKHLHRNRNKIRVRHPSPIMPRRNLSCLIAPDGIHRNPSCDMILPARHMRCHASDRMCATSMRHSNHPPRIFRKSI